MTEQKKAVCCICGSVPDFERGVYEKTPSLQYVCAKHVEYVERGHRTGSWVPFGEGTGVPTYHIEWCEHLKQFVATCEDFLCREYYGDTRSAALAEMLKNIERMSKDGVAQPTRYSKTWAKNEVKRSFLPKATALNLIAKASSLLSEMVLCKDDEKRASLYRRFKHLTESPHRDGTSILLLWSQMANDPEYHK